MDRRFLQPEVSDGSEVLHLKLWEGTAFDYSLNGNSGTVVGTAPAFTFPGISLPGTDEHITIPDSAELSPTTTPLSISAWINMTSATTFMIATKFVTGDTTREWAFYTQGGDLLLLQIYDETQDKFILGYYNSALTGYQGTWIHVASVWNGNLTVPTYADISLYLNGASVAVTDGDDAGFVQCRDTAAIVDIGHSDGAFANGIIDDVRIYNTERTVAEIKDFYEQTKWRYGV